MVGEEPSSPPLPSGDPDSVLWAPVPNKEREPSDFLGPVAPIYDGLCKWKGCALASDGCLYAAPYFSTVVLKIDPQEGDLDYIELEEKETCEEMVTDKVGEGACRKPPADPGIDDPNLDSKWSGIAAGADGLLYCAPCNADTVLVIDPQTHEISHIPGAGAAKFKWSGIAAAANGRLYCAPSQASTVLVIDPASKTLSHISGAGSSKTTWAGICAGGKFLYCAPSMASAVLVVDTEKSKIFRIEGACDGVTFKHRWSGIARSPKDGRLYCSPYNAGTVLVIDPETEDLEWLPGAGSGDCKWSGIAPGMDGRLYCVPSRANVVLVIL